MMGESKHETRAVFTATLALNTPEERSRYLDEVCHGKPSLRQRVEALLCAHEQAHDFLEAHGPEQGGVGEGPGTVISHYKLLEQIGEGGFGLVFMAEQRVPVQRRVALKIIKAGMDTKEVISRFEAERQALALMDHPNIAKVLDAGATESGRPYFVMELVNGIPLTDYCDQYRLSTEQRLQLFIKVCQAVQHAHQKGIIHRDLKPANILVTVIDGEPVPKIIDFGVAKALGQKLTQHTLFTAFQQMVGTPIYMSPEQAALSGMDIDTRSDIYALGVLLYELLTGVTPFDKETLAQAGLDEVRRMVRETEPPKPSTRLRTLGDKVTEVARHRQAEPGALARLVHGDLDWIVMKALEKDRARRYETANELARDIERHIQHEPVSAAAPGMVYRAGKFVRRHRMGVALAGSVTVALIAGLVAAMIGFTEARQERDRALSAEAKAEEQQARAEQAAQRESKQRRRAEASAEAARLEKELAASNLQMAQINLIQSHLDKGEIGPALALLEEQRATVDMQDSRSLEWRHLWWRAHLGHLFTLRGHERGVNAVAFIPDTSLVISAGEDGTVRLWDVTDGVEQTTVAQQQAPILSLAVSPDAKTLAWGDSAGRLVVWDLSGRRPRHIIHTTQVSSLDFSPNSLLIAAGSRDGSVRLWQAETGESASPALQSNYGHFASGVAFSPDGQTLACSSLEYGSVTILDLDELEKRTRLSTHRFEVGAVAFSPDGKTIVSGGNNPTVKLWDLAASREKAEIAPNVRFPVPLALSSDGTRIAIGGDCGTIEVRELASGKTKYYGHVGAVRALAFSPVGGILASAGEDGTVKLWDLTQEDDLPPLHGQLMMARSVAYSPDGRLLAVSGKRVFDSAGNRLGLYAGDSVELWEVSSGRLVRAGTVRGGTCAVFSPDGDVLAGGNWLWDLGAQQPLPSILLPVWDSVVVAFSPDGKTLIEGGYSGGAGQIRLWDWSTRQRRATLEGHSQTVWSLAVSPDGLTLASASAPGTRGRGGEAILWEMDPGRRKRKLEGGCRCVAFSPDGKLLASGSRSGGIAVWDPDTGELLKDMVGHVRSMDHLAFAPDGNTILSCNVQGGVTLWDVEKRVERATLMKRNHPAYSIAVSPDGKSFATGGRDGTLEIWRTASEAEVRAQSDCFDPRLRLARRCEADGLMFQKGLCPKDALRAYEQAERLCQELAADFPNRTDYRSPMWANRNNLAWLLATCAEREFRDGQRARRLAKDVVAATGRSNAMYLDTLAAAHAELGQFGEAVKLQKVAIALLDTLPNKHGCESRLRLYESGVPCRDHEQLARLASESLAQEEFTGAMQSARECLTMRNILMPDSWQKYESCSLLGASLLGQKHYAEAEKELLDAYDGLTLQKDKLPDQGKACVGETLKLLVRLYNETDRAEDAAAWSEKLRTFEQAEDRGRSTLVEVVVAPQHGWDASLDQRWREAAAAYALALQDPAFDWKTARAASPVGCLALQMGMAFVKAGDQENHERLCRVILAAQPDPPSVGEAERLAKLCFLGGNSLPPDLQQRGLEMGRFAAAMPPARQTWEGQDPHWSWLAGGMAEYYAGDVNRALELLQQAAESDTSRCRQVASVYRAMALRKLGRDTEALQVLQKAEALVSEARESRTAEGWWDVDLFEMALEEARQLIAPPTEP